MNGKNSKALEEARSEFTFNLRTSCQDAIDAIGYRMSQMLHFLYSDTDTVQCIVFVHVGYVCTRQRIYLHGLLAHRPGCKTVGVSSGWQGWKVTDPYCRWSVEEEENILLDHTEGLWSQGQRKWSAQTQKRREASDNRQTACACLHISKCTHIHIHPHTWVDVNVNAFYEISLPALFLSRDAPAARCVCHLKVVWRSVNCIQTPASVWDYSSPSWLLSWAPKPILIPFQLQECWSGNSGHVGPLDWFRNAMIAELNHEQLREICTMSCHLVS